MPKYIDADIAWKRLEAAYWEDNGDRDMAEDILDALPAADVAPGEAVREAEKLIRTMKNNKKAALWLKQYGKDEDKS